MHDRNWIPGIAGAVFSFAALSQATTPASAQYIASTPGKPDVDPPSFVVTSVLGGSPTLDLSTELDAYKAAAETETNLRQNPPDDGSGGSPCDPDAPTCVWDANYPTQVANAKAAREAALNAIQTSVDNAGDPNTLAATASCAEQLEPFRYAFDAAGVATEAAGVTSEILTSLDFTGLSESASNAVQAVGVGLQAGSLIFDGVQTFALPSCEGEFTGSLMTHANVIAQMGVSAHDGRVTLGYFGNPDFDADADVPVEYSFDGITIGGGGVGGAGFGGANAFTAHVSAIAIGNGAQALSPDAIAIGDAAYAEGTNATAVGADSRAAGTNTTAFGADARATGTNASALGQNALADGTNVTAVGTDAQAQGSQTAAFGSGAIAAGTRNTAIGDGAQAFDPTTGNFLNGENMTAVGQLASAVADDTTAVGQGALAFDEGASAFGQFAVAYGASSTALGRDSYAELDASTAIGESALALGSRSTATGQNAMASGTSATAMGQASVASGNSATAVGAQAQAAHAGSAAFGAGATTTLERQQVFGVASNTYTMPGLTSYTSTMRQVGPKSLVTTDASGNLAADRGLYDQIGENRQGVAMALALGNFWVPDGKTFAVGMNTSSFDGTYAMGFNMGGKLNESLHVTGGMAVSATGMISARAGGILAW
ncbi:hypothetical protein [Aquibium microcysteis]|uniref:hypothetical protein n=1 Tax=Aquibium microcysteis TaxID=675281 RepID=UPI00165D0453|nr:hypothetical protein [Aquibium microcysteis]